MFVSLVSFGAGSLAYRRAAKRVAEDAGQFGLITENIAAGLHTLEKINDQRLAQVDFSSRGFGFWAWKPFLIKKAMVEAEPSVEVICYLDAGFHVNFNSHSEIRLQEYVEIAVEAGALTFESGPFAEEKFCKMDVLEELGVSQEHRRSNQLAGGLFLIRRDQLDFVEKWCELVSKPEMVDDSPSLRPNANTFIEHRHDQALFSILSKRSNYKVSSDNINLHPSRQDFDSKIAHSIPFWASRHRSGFRSLSMNPLIRSIRMIEQVMP